MKKITSKTTVYELRKITDNIYNEFNPLTKEDYKFIDFYFRANCIPKGRYYEKFIIDFLIGYKLNEKQIKKNNKRNEKEN